MGDAHQEADSVTNTSMPISGSIRTRESMKSGGDTVLAAFREIADTTAGCEVWAVSSCDHPALLHRGVIIAWLGSESMAFRLAEGTASHEGALALPLSEQCVPPRSAVLRGNWVSVHVEDSVHWYRFTEQARDQIRQRSDSEIGWASWGDVVPSLPEPMPLGGVIVPAVAACSCGMVPHPTRTCN